MRDPEPQAASFGGEMWTVTDDEVSRLAADAHGVWMVLTNGTCHVLDLDRWRYLRSPGPGAHAGSMPFDERFVSVTRVDHYPVVGRSFLVWFDAPDSVGPAIIEHFRRSSTVRKIRRLRPPAGHTVADGQTVLGASEPIRRSSAHWREPTSYSRSPVPSDDNLWPGDLPFTAWGQFGEGSLDLRVFDQEVWWIDIHQHPHLIHEMSDEYISNVIGFLVVDATMFFVATLRRLLLQELGDALLGRVSSHLVVDELGAPAHEDLNPREWLESTPLMRALRRRMT